MFYLFSFWFIASSSIPLSFMFSSYFLWETGYTFSQLLLWNLVILLCMIQLSIQRSFALAAEKTKEGTKDDENHRCHCRCGCNAFSKIHVPCIHCLNYISDNSTACQCSFYVHPLTDDAICHMCHQENYAHWWAPLLHERTICRGWRDELSFRLPCHTVVHCIAALTTDIVVSISIATEDTELLLHG